ncbi:TPA: Rha family transcriptional regulator, partial [Campylobacter jejuni]|nr:Rha family transcriptional regulator [Campylobacter jejuni]
MERLAVINGVDVELEVVDNAVYTTSLSVAEVFNKNHKNIIRKINEFPKDNFTKLNFEPSKYIDSTGRVLPCYKITRDGFSLLVMGFTGEKAYKWKIEFIKAFNEMEKRLRNIEYEKHDKLAFHQSLGYKSQLKQQKQKYENEIKALKYDLEQSKNNFKDKLNCILAKNGLYAFDFKTFKNYALKLEKMLKDLKDDENKENKLLLRMQN